MNKKRLSIIAALAFVFILGGCSLAKKDAGKEVLDSESISEDRLIGVLVTKEHLDLFDFDAFVSGSDDYHGRIYATVDKHGSDEADQWECDFDWVEGYMLFSPTMQHGEQDPFIMTAADDSFSDAKPNYIFSDGGEEIQLEGTLYLQAGKAHETYYLNPVHQTEDGEIYVGTGNGLSSNVIGEDGNDMSSTLSATTNLTVDGVTKSYKCSVDVRFVTVDTPTKVRFYHMTETHEALKVEEFVPEEVPEEMQVEEGTCYVLIETEKVNSGGVSAIEREISEPDEEGQITVKTFIPSEDGILKAKYTKIVF